jgi:uncharacterized membrane protein HdeD (DUF308 family)
MINLTQNWWLVVLRGVAGILFGIAAFVWPGPTLFVLVTLFGLYALVDGFIAVATGIGHTKDSPRWWVFLLEGLVGIVAGVIALIWPAVTTLALLSMIAVWSIITGILEIIAAIRLRRAITNEWMLALGGILSVALGIVLILQPLAGILVIVWTIGAYAMIFGVLWIILGFHLRSVDKTLRPRTVYISPSKKGSISRL